MKSTYWFSAAGLSALILAGLAVHSQNPTTQPSRTLAMPRAISFRIALGVDRQTATWDGSIQVSSGRITNIQGIFFADGDETDGKSNWKLKARPAAVGGAWGQLRSTLHAAQRCVCRQASTAPSIRSRRMVASPLVLKIVKDRHHSNTRGLT